MIGPMKSVKHRDFARDCTFHYQSIVISRDCPFVKNFLGRARPYLVFSGQMDFAPWYKVGANHFIGDGAFSGHFRRVIL